MAQTRLHDTPIGKAAAHIVRARTGRHVVIAGGAAHEGIADTAPDGIRGKTGILQAGNDVANRLRQKHSGILLWRKMEIWMGENGKQAVEKWKWLGNGSGLGWKSMANAVGWEIGLSTAAAWYSGGNAAACGGRCCHYRSRFSSTTSTLIVFVLQFLPTGIPAQITTRSPFSTMESCLAQSTAWRKRASWVACVSARTG